MSVWCPTCEQRRDLADRVEELEAENEHLRAEVRDVVETWIMPDVAQRRLIAVARGDQ